MPSKRPDHHTELASGDDSSDFLQLVHENVHPTGSETGLKERKIRTMRMLQLPETKYSEWFFVYAEEPGWSQ